MGNFEDLLIETEEYIRRRRDKERINEYIIPIKNHRDILSDRASRRDKERINENYFTLGSLEDLCKPKKIKPIENTNLIEYMSLDKILNKKYDLKEIFINKKNLESSIPKYIPSYGGIGLKLGDNVNVTAENIPQFAEPIVEFIRQMRPDYIIACDRGARFIGFAVKALYNELYGRLPTTDGSVRFRRISKSTPKEETKAYLKPLVKEMTSARTNPRVLILDDWIVSGSTKQLIEEIFEQMAPGKIDLRYGVLLGANADVSGNADKTSSFAGCVEWHDDAKMIGLDYNGTKPRVLMSPTARDYRTRILESCRNYAQRITGETSAQVSREIKQPRKHSFLTKLGKKRDDKDAAA